ncbi:hypothetical protein CGRA01v4_01313 [Colletotrichum graminicola]|uniref:Rhodopsin domain-containing protein n=1 Tax=Colletotrichum graminicola (strain M1.001 / M2 / FGSC 10212) TaxID=645133 RepID=E3QWD1_COLGM|nr:uncharacterized protein GLRG_10313 [Colletotrichum graminicola M1.001]EFQ35169.1 hypothetical protein GLRG_10313 [Colletotrichum graminicola M1.001]WDK10034.1 hypothetical protein CGRA01v4_01313 [Colletotrichum graminicola]
MIIEPREKNDQEAVRFVNPYLQLNVGLWSLFAGATIFLALRLWCKITRRHGLWYDDYILIVSWSVLLANNSLIIYEFATGYVLEDSSKAWDDRMHILINISSCGTLIGQAWTKTAFGVTLIRMSNQWQRWILYFCIATMNIYMVAKVFIQWGKVCGSKSYDNDYRLQFCLDKQTRNDVKEGGNVYNIIMDFVFASFPWFITRSLEMKRAEKIGLCITMSLGMIVAIVSAIRVSWKDSGNDRDPWYIYRNGVSQVWYSSEITGTIIVQCIPILRPILREIHTSLTSKKLGSSTTDRRSTAFGSKTSSKKRVSGGAQADDKHAGERIALQEIPEEYSDDKTHWGSSPRMPSSATPFQTEFKPRPPTAPLPGWGSDAGSSTLSPHETEFKPRPPTSPLPSWGSSRGSNAGPSTRSAHGTEFKPRRPTSPLPSKRALLSSDGRPTLSPYNTAFRPRTPTSPRRPASPLPELWPLSGNEGPDLTVGSYSLGKSLDFDLDRSKAFLDVELGDVQQGLSPPPPRRTS